MVFRTQGAQRKADVTGRLTTHVRLVRDADWMIPVRVVTLVESDGVTDLDSDGRGWPARTLELIVSRLAAVRAEFHTDHSTRDTDRKSARDEPCGRTLPGGCRADRGKHDDSAHDLRVGRTQL